AVRVHRRRARRDRQHPRGRARRAGHRRRRRTVEGLPGDGGERGGRVHHPDRDPPVPPGRPARRPHPGEGMTALRYWVPALFLLLAAYPFLPVADMIRGQQFTVLFVYAILALGLNTVLGYTGLLHLGIAAFFGIGAYTVGILTVPFFPFQQSFLVAALAAVVVSAAVGVASTAPILRLRGDYFALVTLGFGLITLYAIRNLAAITEGTKGLNPIEAGPLPGVKESTDLSGLQVNNEWGNRWYKYPYLYFVILGTLGLVMLFLRNLEHSRLGRAWVALR